MVKTFRFLLQFAWINLGTILGFALIVTAGAWLTGVPQGADNLFRTYFSMFPLLTLIVLFIYAFALCTSNLNLALSFGARRRDFFWAVQGILLVYAGTAWALQLAMSSIPVLFHWPQTELWLFLMSLGGFHSGYYPLVCLTILALGCLCGLVFVRSKFWGVMVMLVTILIGIAATALLMITGDFTHIQLWNDLPILLFLGMAAAMALGEWIIWRTIRRFMVR